MANLFSEEGFVTGIPLSQYTNAITNAVARAPGLSGVWVTAELSDVRLAGGHCYMELIEKNDVGQTIAKLRATIWRSNYPILRQKFYSATQREIGNGIKALVRGSATHHSIYGLSFNITDIDPSYTMGDMERVRREIIMRLQKEGIADQNKRLRLPVAPQRIAILSAEGAAGYGDFINHLTGNSEGYVFYPHLFPCVMQGERVSESIRRALELIESTIDLWDCVVIIRGGGATTDMNGFDEYQLAKAVATFHLPIVVGIGHERDRNVLDDLAHTSLKTPTAVAGFFIDKMREANEQVALLAEKIRLYAKEMLIGEERRLSSFQNILPQFAIRRVEYARSRLQTIIGGLPLNAQRRVSNERMKLQGMLATLSAGGSTLIQRASQILSTKLTMLENSTRLLMDRERQKVENAAGLIKVLDPKNTLSRGYSITRVNGKTVKSIADISLGDTIITTLPDGQITSRAEA
ncbi:MAG: exodeoxyribonuclease VII large subunit [Muribaculaceae bacterium]|nr:exodeoxyribonuclease VII large subunit [Muribaculaceae bacterium]